MGGGGRRGIQKLEEQTSGNEVRQWRKHRYASWEFDLAKNPRETVSFALNQPYCLGKVGVVVKGRVLIASEYQIGIPNRSLGMACRQSYHYRAGHNSCLGLVQGFL